MKRKLFSIFTSVALCLVCLFSFTACDFLPTVDGDDKDDGNSGVNNGGNTQIAVTGIELDETELTLDVGDTETLIAAVSPNNATDKTVIWQSSDESVATVVSGKVTALKQGSATITATAGDKAATCTVTVIDGGNSVVEVTGLSLNKTSLSLEVGDIETLIATVSPNNATDKTVSWQSSDNSVIKVDNGEITAIGAGTATITATVNGKSDNCKITVKEKTVAVTNVSLDETSLYFKVGESQTLNATVLPDNAAEKEVTWESSDVSVATVESGKVTALKEGTATITATAGGKSATCMVTVPITLKELRCHASDYEMEKVVVVGTVVANFNNSVYLEDFDEETGLCFGIPVYYGYQTGKLLEILSVGNRVKVVGTLTEFQGTYQISGLSYNRYDENDPDNCAVLGTEAPAFVETDADDIVSGKLNIKLGDETVALGYGEAILSTTVTVKELTVTKIYTTDNGGNNNGAMTLTCKAQDGTEIIVRTSVLKDEDGNLITADRYEGKTITVKGLVEKYEDAYQIKCYQADYITVL